MSLPSDDEATDSLIESGTASVTSIISVGTSNEPENVGSRLVTPEYGFFLVARIINHPPSDMEEMESANDDLVDR